MSGPNNAGEKDGKQLSKPAGAGCALQKVNAGTAQLRTAGTRPKLRRRRPLPLRGDSQSYNDEIPDPDDVIPE